MLNRVTIMGRLTARPELRRTQGGTAVTSFTLAVARDFKDKNTGEKAADFIDCIAWRNTAEFVSSHFDKGSMAAVSGSLQVRHWKDKDGNNRRSAEVVVDQIYFGDSKKENTPSSDTGNSAFHGAYIPPGTGMEEISDDDGPIPF